MRWPAPENQLDQSRTSVSDAFELKVGCRLGELMISDRLLPLAYYANCQIGCGVLLPMVFRRWDTSFRKLRKTAGTSIVPPPPNCLFHNPFHPPLRAAIYPRFTPIDCALAKPTPATRHCRGMCCQCGGRPRRGCEAAPTRAQDAGRWAIGSYAANGEAGGHRLPRDKQDQRIGRDAIIGCAARKPSRLQRRREATNIHIRA